MQYSHAFLFPQVQRQREDWKQLIETIIINHWDFKKRENKQDMKECIAVSSLLTRERAGSKKKVSEGHARASVKVSQAKKIRAWGGAMKNPPSWKVRERQRKNPPPWKFRGRQRKNPASWKTKGAVRRKTPELGPRGPKVKVSARKPPKKPPKREKVSQVTTSARVKHTPRQHFPQNKPTLGLHTHRLMRV